MIALVILAIVPGLTPIGPWKALNEGYRCTLGRPYEAGAEQVTLQFWRRPGNDVANGLMLAVPFEGGSYASRSHIYVALGTETKESKRSARWERSLDGRTSVVQVTLSKTESKDAVRGGALSFSTTPKHRYILSLGGGSNADSALTACTQNLLRSWGGDPIVQEQATPPEPINQQQFLSSLHFPSSPAIKGQSGETVVRYRVTAAGKVESCTPLFQSGAPEFDNAACLALAKCASNQQC